MISKAIIPEQYLAELPEERRHAIATVRQTILDNLPEGYVEEMGYGMITYVVPLSVYPSTYNQQPSMYAALASQKNHMAVYLTAPYGEPKIREEFQRDYLATGKKLDMGGSCVRFKKLDNLPLEVIGNYIARVPMQLFVERTRAFDETRKKK